MEALRNCFEEVERENLFLREPLRSKEDEVVAAHIRGEEERSRSV
jgi:hypothetical protein